MEIRSKGYSTRESLFKDEKINQIYQEYYKLNKNISIEKMEKFLENIDLIITRDFGVIRAYTEYKEREILKLQFEKTIFSLIGIRKKAAEKYINNNIKLEMLLEDREEYFENFALELNLDDLENSLINSFKLYYEIGSSRPRYKEYIVEIYTTYKTMIASIIHMLPSSYRKELFETDYFSSLKNDLKCLECYDDFTTDYNMAFNIEKFDSVLRKYIKEKFNVDLYDYSIEKRERKLD